MFSKREIAKDLADSFQRRSSHIDGKERKNRNLSCRKMMVNSCRKCR